MASATLVLRPVCFAIFAQMTLGLTVIPSEPELPFLASDVVSLGNSLATGMGNEDINALANTIANSSAKGNATLLGEAMTDAVGTAAVSNQYNGFSYAEQAASASALGQALNVAGVSDTVQTDALVQAFINALTKPSAGLTTPPWDLETTPSYLTGYGYAEAILLVANAADKAASFKQMFTQARSANVSIENLNNVVQATSSSLPLIAGPLQTFANDIYGATQYSLAGANATQMAGLIGASIFLKLDYWAFGALWVTALGEDRENFTAYYDTYSSFITTAKKTATSVAQAVQAAKIPSSVQAAGLTLSITKYLGSSPYASSQFVAIPAAVAVQLGQSEAVFQSVLQVNQTLDELCPASFYTSILSLPASAQFTRAIEARFGHGSSHNCSISTFLDV